MWNMWVVERRKNICSYSPSRNTRTRGHSMEIKGSKYKTVKKKSILYNAQLAHSHEITLSLRD